MQKLAIGIDINDIDFKIGCVTEDDRILYFEKNSSRIFDNGNVINIIYTELMSYMNKYNITADVKAIAFGIPSMISKDKKTIISASNLKGFNNVDLVPKLEKKLGIPVFLDRDVNFLLLNDIKMLKLDKTKTILGFYIGSNFGNAIYIDGKIYTGKNGVAGELGHIPFIDCEEKCSCGNIGCSEVRCSSKSLEKTVEKFFPDTHINLVFMEHGSDPVIEKYIHDLAIPIATEINILDPDYIILSGEIIYMPDFPKDKLVKNIRDMTRKPYPENNLKIYFSEHIKESGVYGSGNFAHLNSK